MNGMTMYLPDCPNQVPGCSKHPSFPSLTLLIINRFYLQNVDGIQALFSILSSWLKHSPLYMLLRLHQCSSPDHITSSLIFHLTTLHAAFIDIFLNWKFDSVIFFYLLKSLHSSLEPDWWKLSFLTQRAKAFLIWLTFASPISCLFTAFLSLTTSRLFMILCLSSYRAPIFLANSSWFSKIRMFKNLIFMEALSGWLSVRSHSLLCQVLQGSSVELITTHFCVYIWSLPVDCKWPEAKDLFLFVLTN